MGKTWKRRKPNNSRDHDAAMFASNGKPVARRNNHKPHGVAAVPGTLAETDFDPHRFEDWRRTGCQGKCSYTTLQQASDAKATLDAKYNCVNHVYRCKFCNRYHLTTQSTKASNVIDDRFLPTPTDHSAARRTFGTSLASVMSATHTDASSLAKQLDITEDIVSAWLDDSVYPIHRLRDISAALGCKLAELL